MGDTTIKKIDSRHSPRGAMGQRYLATGQGIAMRLWETVQPGASKAPRSRPYETVGYVVSGRAVLECEGQRLALGPGDSWLVPRGAAHTYIIEESFTAVEATHPPALLHDRDAAPEAREPGS